VGVSIWASMAIHTVGADGTGPTRVTNSGQADRFPDWGRHPTIK
jgi:hypothetical protein